MLTAVGRNRTRVGLYFPGFPHSTQSSQPQTHQVRLPMMLPHTGIITQLTLRVLTVPNNFPNNHFNPATSYEPLCT